MTGAEITAPLLDDELLELDEELDDELEELELLLEEDELELDELLLDDDEELDEEFFLSPPQAVSKALKQTIR